MAKLTLNQGTAPAGGGAPVAATPVPFQAQPLTAEKKAKAPREPKAPKELAPRKADFFNAYPVKRVVQRRTYAKRGGFMCAACGIPGSNAFVVELEKGGKKIEILDPNDNNKVIEVLEHGCEVGERCLTEYGGVNLKQYAQGQQAPAPATTEQQAS